MKVARDKFQKLFAFDNDQKVSGLSRVAGVDEAGRGPLAGPVVAAAVIFRKKSVVLKGLNDSKQVPAKERERLYLEIARVSITGIGVASHEEIDQLNIFQATRLAMKRALLSLTRTPDFILVDGPIKLDVPVHQKAVIGGDRQSAVIAAASIVAKVYRDGLMHKFDKEYPGYFFAKHKGYATKTHLESLSQLGPCAIHRKNFSPVKRVVNDGADADFLDQE